MFWKSPRFITLFAREAGGEIQSAANENSITEQAALAEPKPGDTMPDGTVYAGISPDTQKPMYASPQDALVIGNFSKAYAYASGSDAHGHEDWRVPTKKELVVLFNNRAAIGGFNVVGRDPQSLYWSSSRSDEYVWFQNFKDGGQSLKHKIYGDAALRCVRG